MRHVDADAGHPKNKGDAVMQQATQLRLQPVSHTWMKKCKAGSHSPKQPVRLEKVRHVSAGAGHLHHGMRELWCMTVTDANVYRLQKEKSSRYRMRAYTC